MNGKKKSGTFIKIKDNLNGKILGFFDDIDKTGGNNISLSITADSKEQADQLFKSLSEGGKVSMPMDTTFWGSYFGMCSDRFDINWMISFGEAPKE